MTAKGKINASNVQAGHRIIIKVTETGSIHESRNKTGEGVQIVRVLGKTFRAASGPYEARGKYIITTSAGSFECAPIQTMWLAPEDAAGIKRAHVEALAEDRERDLAAHEELAAELAQDEQDTAQAHAEALEFNPEAGASAPDANRHSSQTGGVRALTLHSQAGKVDDMDNDAGTDHLDIEITPSGAAKIAAHLAKTAPAADNHTGSSVVTLLEKVWARIREDHPELPAVVIITGSGLVGASKWGHFRAEGWKVREEGAALRKHELFLAGEALAKGARQVLQTMLHEAAHTLARVRDLKDTSRQGRWHNATFRKLAEEMGLEHKGATTDSSHGFSFVTLTQTTADRYADLLEELDREIRLVCHLPVWLGGETDQDDKGGERITGKAPKGEDDGDKPKSGPLKAVCECEEPLIIRLSQKTLDLKVVRCDQCEALFTAA